MFLSSRLRYSQKQNVATDHDSSGILRLVCYKDFSPPQKIEVMIWMRAFEMSFTKIDENKKGHIAHPRSSMPIR